FQALCTKEKLLAAFGDRLGRLSTANTYSYRKVDVPFQEYVEHLLKPQDLATLGSGRSVPGQATDNSTRHRTLRALAALWGTKGVLPAPPLSPLSVGSGSGVPFHWHGPGYSEVIFGRKRWFLYPPDKTPHFHPNETTLAWLHHTYPTLPPGERPLECTPAPPGRSQWEPPALSPQVLYFPDRWWHATLNLDTSVFISTFLG
ncbi:JmjC domain-containing protein 8, partial [Struthio camelus australis]